MKDKVKIYDKLDKNIIKKFTISTISTMLRQQVASVLPP